MFKAKSTDVLYCIASRFKAHLILEYVESFLLYMVSIASWLVVWFACFELFHEWIDEVAIRRVYYLEYNHWEGAKDELKRTMLDAIQPQISRGATERVVPEKHLFERPVWIPHPEQRDTPSNVELYSVLVGGIPSRPDEAMNPDDVEEAVIDSQVDWQMELVSTFFDSCVPNMPGCKLVLRGGHDNERNANSYI